MVFAVVYLQINTSHPLPRSPVGKNSPLKLANNPPAVNRYLFSFACRHFASQYMGQGALLAVRDHVLIST
jgi:hypothetical protein